MKRLFQPIAITFVLVLMASVACAATTTIRSAKSNSDNRVVVYDSLTPAQATAFLAEWDKIPLASTTEAAVRQILEKKGPNAVNVKLARVIVRTDMNPPRVIVLADPAAESAALAFTVSVTPSNQATAKHDMQKSIIGNMK